LFVSFQTINDAHLRGNVEKSGNLSALKRIFELIDEINKSQTFIGSQGTFLASLAGKIIKTRAGCSRISMVTRSNSAHTATYRHLPRRAETLGPAPPVGRVIERRNRGVATRSLSVGDTPSRCAPEGEHRAHPERKWGALRGRRRFLSALRARRPCGADRANCDAGVKEGEKGGEQCAYAWCTGQACIIATGTITGRLGRSRGSDVRYRESGEISKSRTRNLAAGPAIA